MDEYGATRSGPIWWFETELNIPPNEPSNPDPPDGAVDVFINADLSWTGGDPNSGDEVTYDVYFGKTNPPPKVMDNQSDTNTATDPNEDKVKYHIDWGDGTNESTSLNPSGETVTVSHTWAEKGDYTITVKAEDEHGLTGPAATLKISMPKNKPFNFNFNLLERLLDRFPDAFPILHRLVDALKVNMGSSCLG